MSDKAAFSIIIPVYNVQKDIGNCLDSILAQSYRNFEVLCIDDGSTDHSSQVIQKYAKKTSVSNTFIMKIKESHIRGM